MSEEKIKEIIEQADNNKPKKPGFFARLRTYLFTGILVTAPAAMTFYIAYVIFSGIDINVTKLIPQEYNPSTYLPYGVPGLGILVLFVFLITVGFLTTGFFGRFIFGLWEKMLNRTPLVSGMYGALKQIFETVFSKKSNAFRQAVLVEFPRRETWTIAFVTGTVPNEVKAKLGEEDELINLYVPTTPNPTSGYIIMLPKKDVIPLSIKVEDALKYIISTGIVLPKE